MRFITMVKSAEKAGLPPPALMGAIAKLGEEAGKAGVMRGMGGCLPSATGARIRLSGGKLRVSEGPFGDAEILGGYAFWEFESRQQAIEWSSRFLELHQQHWPGWEGEVELRQLLDAPGGSQP